MKINKTLKNYIYEIDEVMQNNIEAARFFNEHFCYWQPSISTKKLGMLNKDELLKTLITKFDEEESVEIEDEFYDTYLKPAVREISIEAFKDNVYLKNIKFKNAKSGEMSYSNAFYEAYELIPLDEIKVDEKTYKETSQIGYFNKALSYPILDDGEAIWMAINPNEIKTMKKHIDAAKGHVLVLGLGLGYYPYMLSENKTVTKITIIENDKDVIALFKNNLLSQFPNKNMIEIVEDDAFLYLNNHIKNGTFDSVFADIWHSVDDGFIIFINLKKLEKKYNIPFMYWLDTSMFAMARRCIVTILYEYFEMPDINYDIVESDQDAWINLIHGLIKDIDLNTKEELDYLLSEKGINELLLK